MNGMIKTVNVCALSPQLAHALLVSTGITSAASVSAPLFQITLSFRKENSGIPEPAHSFAFNKSVLLVNT